MYKSIVFGICLLSCLGFSIATLAVKSTHAESNYQYSNDQLHKWACNVAIQFDNNKSNLGCYDICDSLAIKVPAINGDYPGYHVEGGQVSMNVSLELPADIQNACAIVLHGAEW
jgi:hypothetical protein